MRVVSLIASSTEIICALGARDQLVGRSHECDFPLSVQPLPVCTEMKLNINVSSRDIDTQVRKIVSEGLSVYRVLPDILQKLQPDLIVTQTQCEVCAVSLKDVEVAVYQLVSSHPEIVSLHPNALPDVWADIRCVAQALGCVARGEELIAALQERMWVIEQKATHLAQQPTVAYIEWVDPLISGGNWMPDLVRMAGGINLFGTSGIHSPNLKWDDVVAANPDVIFIAPCGYDMARTAQDLPLLQARPEWAQLKAVKTKRVVMADGNQFFNRPGPRVVESLEILAEVLHPEQFDYGHENSGWRRVLC